MTAENIEILCTALAGFVTALGVFIKWRRDRDMLVVRSNTHQIKMLWSHIDGQDQTIRSQQEEIAELKRLIGELRDERHRLRKTNQSLVRQNEGQAGEIRTLQDRNKAMVAQMAEMEKHIAALEDEIKTLKESKP